MVYKDDDHRALWASDTLSNGGTKLIIQGDGNLGISHGCQPLDLYAEVIT